MNEIIIPGQGEAGVMSIGGVQSATRGWGNSSSLSTAGTGASSASPWGGIISSVLQAGMTGARVAAQSSAVASAEQKTSLMSHIMQAISLVQRRKEELKQMGTLREAKDFANEQRGRMEDELKERKRARSYQMGRADMSGILQGLNNIPVLRDRMVEILRRRR